MTRNRPTSRGAVGFLLLLADVIGLLALFNLAYWLRLDQWIGLRPWGMYGPIVITLLALYIFNTYQGRMEGSSLKLAFDAALAVVLAGLITAIFVYLAGFGLSEPVFNRGIMPVALVLFIPWAALSRYYVSEGLKRQEGKIRWIVLGEGERARFLWKDFKLANAGGELLFVSGPEETGSVSGDNGLPQANIPNANLHEIVALNPAGVILALDVPPSEELLTELMQLRLGGLHVYELADFYETFMMKVPVFHLRQGWFVSSQGFELLHHTIWLKVKGLIDVAVAAVLLVICSPIMITAAILIKVSSPGRVFYKQVRTGKDGAEFTIYKFRTMVENAESDGARWAERNDPRISPVGRVLRKLRIDELPQLWNVLKGDMSFIGPRPERPSFAKDLEKHIPFYEIRNLIKPGITGWAQVMYPYGASIEDAREKLQFDLYYIKNYSLMLDLWIMFKTIRVVLGAGGR